MDINRIYNNSFGIAFQWKRGTSKQLGKIQVIFRDTGLLLSKQELVQFAKLIECAKQGNELCGECTRDKNCRGLLLDTPAPQITLAVSYMELCAIQNLVEGTLFHMSLDNYINEICGGD